MKSKRLFYIDLAALKRGVSKKNIIKFCVMLSFFICFLIVILRINENNTVYQSKSAGSYVSGVVTDILQDNTEADYEHSGGLRIGTQEIKVKVLSGEHKGEIHQIDNDISALFNIYVEKGTKVMLLITSQQNGSYHVSVYGYDRTRILAASMILFLLLLVMIGGWKGLKSILGLLFTIASFLLILVPLVSKGYPAVSITLVLVVVTSAFTFITLDGIQIKTVAAMAGTVLGVGIAAVFSFVVEKFAHLSGYNMEEAENLMLLSSGKGIPIKGLLTAGILIASLGAVMDIAISISSAVCEIYGANKKLKFHELFTSGMNIGKDAMGTMSNTLIMAFAGSSLNMFLLVFSYGIPLFRLLNTDQIAIEILQAIAGCVGIIFSVPIVAAVVSLMLQSKAKTAGRIS